MDEARNVLERLRRIEILEREGASPRHLLEEIRALLLEADAWIRSERGDTRRAAQALERCFDALEREPVGTPR